MKLSIIWILVANNGYADLFELKGKEIRLIGRQDHPEGRMKIHDLVSDRPGRTFAIASTERHHLGEEEDRVRRHNREIFIHELMHLLSKAKSDLLFDQLVVVAPPEFLGDMRKVFKKHPILETCMKQEIPKDLPSYLSMDEKVNMLTRYLQI